MMHKKTIFGGLVLSALSFSSCSEYSLMDDEAIRMGLFGEEYSENFENAYGKIAPDQTWDFSSYNLRRLGLAGGPGATPTTRATNPNQTNYTGKTDATSADKSAILASNQTPTGFDGSAMTDGYYNVQSETFGWLNTNLPEGEQNPLNVTNGQPFVLGKPQKNFAIIPIYQGHAGMCWDLHLVDKATNKDYTLWSKSEGIRYKLDFSKGEEIDVRDTDISEYQGDEYNKFEVAKFDNMYFDDYDGTSDIKISVTIPAWRYLKGKFENKNGSGWTMGKNTGTTIAISGGQNIDGENPYEWVDAESTSYYTFDNRGGDTPKTYTITLGDEEKNWVREKGIQFVVTNNINEWTDGSGTHYDKCFFKYYSSDRVKVSVKYNATKWINLETANNGSPELSNEAGHTVNREAVQAKPIVIDGSKISGDMYLYLKITREDPDNGGESGYGKLGACQRSDEYMMVALPCTQPTNIGTSQAMIIGCEDSNTAKSDWDVNDIVFLVVGQGELPDVQEVVAAKRYMIEDLGSTFDFDFNDIVVDVTQYRVKDYLGTVKSTKTVASLKHLCGTIPFQIKIGNTILGGENKKYPGCNANSAQGGSGCDPTKCSDHFEEYKSAIDCVVEGWNPSENNITVTTWPKAAGTEWNDKDESDFLGEKDSQTFSFPENGEFPYIIATDQTVLWTKEMMSVPSSWFKTWPANYDKWPNHSQDTPQQGGGENTIESYTVSSLTLTRYNENGFNNGNVTIPARDVDTSKNIEVKVTVKDSGYLKGVFEVNSNKTEEIEFNGTNTIELTSEQKQALKEGNLKFLVYWYSKSNSLEENGTEVFNDLLKFEFAYK